MWATAGFSVLLSWMDFPEKHKFWISNLWYVFLPPYNYYVNIHLETHRLNNRDFSEFFRFDSEKRNSSPVSKFPHQRGEIGCAWCCYAHLFSLHVGAHTLLQFVSILMQKPMYVTPVWMIASNRLNVKIWLETSWNMKPCVFLPLNVDYETLENWHIHHRRNYAYVIRSSIHWPHNSNIAFEHELQDATPIPSQ